MQIEDAFKKLERIDHIEYLLRQIQKELKIEEKDDIGDIRMASIITGLAPATLYVYTSKKIIPHFKRPGTSRIYFSRKKLEAWIREGEKGID